MINPKIFLSFFVISISSLLLFSNYAFAVSNFQENDDICSNVSSLTTMINVTDGTDFDFVQDEDYLIIAQAKFGANSTFNSVILRLQHDNTTFAGSEMDYEVERRNANCGGAGDGNDMNNYFWFTLWTPNATEATQDIIFEIDSPQGEPVQHDDVTITIIQLSEMLTEGIDYFFNEVKTTETLATGFATPNNATITFTPTNNNDNWMVMGSNQIDTGSAVISYESRIFFNGTETDFPFMSEEGEDPTNDSYVQTMSRNATLPNTQQQIQMQSQIATAGAGTHERNYSSIFALNLDKFREHTVQWIEGETALSAPLFGDQILSVNHVVPVNNTDIFILADFGSKDDRFEARVQQNQTDVLSGMTSQEYRFSEVRQGTDILRWTTPIIKNVVNGTHTIDVDTSTLGASTIYQSLIVFSLNAQQDFNFTDPFSWNDDIRIDLTKNFTDPLSINDFINATTTKSFEDPFSWNDDTRMDLTKNFTNAFSWNDDIRIDLTKDFTDPMSMNDFINATTSKSFEDPNSWIDFINVTIAKPSEDPFSWNDDTRIDLTKNFTNPVSFTDFINATIGKSFDDPNSWIDFINVTISKPFDNPFSWNDDIRLDIVNTDDDPVSFTDFINATIAKSFDEPFTWIDTINTFVTFGQQIIVVPPPTGGGGGGSQPPTIPDSDGDGILDPEDACPLEPEDFDGFQDADGCPEDGFIQPPQELVVPSIVDLIPFEFNELDVIDDFIDLEVDLPQAQVADLGVRWLGAEPITITSIDIGLSPFEIQVQDIPLTFGNNRFGFTETQLLYTVQPPDKICGDVFTFDCLDKVTYKIPVVITGEINGKTVIADGSITIDNSDRINPYWLALFGLILVPLVSVMFWKKRNTKVTTKQKLKVTQSKPNTTRTLTVTKSKPLKSGTTRKLLTESKKTNILGRKSK